MKTFIVVLGAVSLFSLPLFVSAAGVPTNSAPRAANQASAPKADKKAHGFPFHGNVEAVDKAAKSITMEGKMHRVFHVTSDTKINKDKKPVKLEALTAGDYVGGYAREAPDGKLELVTLNITSQAAAPKASSGKASK